MRKNRNYEYMVFEFDRHDWALAHFKHKLKKNQKIAKKWKKKSFSPEEKSIQLLFKKVSKIR